MDRIRIVESLPPNLYCWEMNMAIASYAEVGGFQWMYCMFKGGCHTDSTEDVLRARSLWETAEKEGI